MTPAKGLVTIKSIPALGAAMMNEPRVPKPPLPPTIVDGGTLALPRRLAHFHLHH